MKSDKVQAPRDAFSFRFFSFSVSRNYRVHEIDGHGSTGVELENKRKSETANTRKMEKQKSIKLENDFENDKAKKNGKPDIKTGKRRKKNDSTIQPKCLDLKTFLRLGDNKCAATIVHAIQVQHIRSAVVLRKHVCIFNFILLHFIFSLRVSVACSVCVSLVPSLSFHHHT